MELIISAASIALIVFGVDYARSWLSPLKYRYVSYETGLLLFMGLISSVLSFKTEFIAYFSGRFHVELLFIGILFTVALLLAFLMKQQGLQICTTALRPYKCISPAYVVIKSQEILLQQLLWLMIAIGVSREITAPYLQILLFSTIFLIIFIPILSHVKRHIAYTYGLILLLLSPIFFYTYIALELFWPAAYIQAILYVFLWIALAEPSE